MGKSPCMSPRHLFMSSSVSILPLRHPCQSGHAALIVNILLLLHCQVCVHVAVEQALLSSIISIPFLKGATSKLRAVVASAMLRLPPLPSVVSSLDQSRGALAS
eukprot:TRINITY_DN20625_c0_g1_i1.p2 TRINITY_DN20625_c0_g1~~TRINITY_DN20625_c0_g1_i1.p2  ORF type:complete len:104 (+),score=21.20 TRINITY_DN20625_c0_g1_i1:235-546(+)